MDNTVNQDRKVFRRRLLKYTWNLFWPLLCMVALLFGFWDRLVGLYWIVVIALCASPFNQIYEVAFDNEFRKEYYKRKATPFEQVFFLVLPLLLPLVITFIPWAVNYFGGL